MKELKPFLTKIRPTLLLTEAPLVSARGLTEDVETHGFDISKMFCQNINTLYTKHVYLPTFVPPYYFPCVTLACILSFSKIYLFTFLVHLELINYFSCVTLACILFFS